MHTICGRIETLRYERGLSQTDLAKKLGLGKSTVVAWETGTSKPHIEFLPLVAKFFNVTTDYLLGIEKAEYSLDISELNTNERREMVDLLTAIKERK